MKECVKKWLTEQVGDDEFLLQTLYDDYRGTLTKQLAQARSDMAGGDFAALDRTAHAMKGATLTVGDAAGRACVARCRQGKRSHGGRHRVGAAGNSDCPALTVKGMSCRRSF